MTKKKYKYPFYNIGSNDEVSILEIIKIIKRISNFSGKIIFDKTKPKGQMRRVLDSTKMNSLGWKAKIRLEDGLKQVYEYYSKNNN